MPAHSKVMVKVHCERAATEWCEDRQAASEIETRLEKNGFDSSAINTEVFAQAQQAFGLFDQMMQLGQHRRITLLREIATRREFENVLEKSGGAAKVDRKPSFGPVSSSMNSGFGLICLPSAKRF